MKNMPHRLTKFIVCLSFIMVAPSVRALSVKADPLAANGCIPKVSLKNAQAAIKRFHLHTRNARPSEVRTLGTALVWIEKLNNGKPLVDAVGDEGYAYNFQSATRNSHQAGNEIRVNRNGKKNYGENVAQLVHELGHLIGNRGGYEDYQDFVGSNYCTVSAYSDHNDHEQFAEVFAAFVTRPELIRKNHSSACQKAFKFFSTQIFAKAGPTALRCMEHQTEVWNRMNAPQKPKTTNAAAPLTTNNAKSVPLTTNNVAPVTTNAVAPTNMKLITNKPPQLAAPQPEPPAKSANAGPQQQIEDLDEPDEP
jgi:hypothetical protein